MLLRKLINCLYVKNTYVLRTRCGIRSLTALREKFELFPLIYHGILRENDLERGNSFWDLRHILGSIKCLGSLPLPPPPHSIWMSKIDFDGYVSIGCVEICKMFLKISRAVDRHTGGVIC